MAATETKLRAFRRSDFETLHKIDQLCFPKGIAYGRIELRIYLGSPGASCLLAETGGEVSGFIITERTDEVGHVITLDVVEAFRRQTIGYLLLDAAELDAASHGVTRMCLETATSNKPAIAFWRKHGYLQTGIANNYYGWGQDALEMEKELGFESAREEI